MIWYITTASASIWYFMLMTGFSVELLCWFPSCPVITFSNKGPFDAFNQVFAGCINVPLHGEHLTEISL